MNRLIEQEKSGSSEDPEKEANACLERLSTIERKRRGFQEITAEGLMSLPELKERLAQLDEQREIAEEALEAFRLQRSRLEALEWDAEALLTFYPGMMPERLDELHPEEHQRIYKMLRLKASIYADGCTKLSGVLVPKDSFYTTNITSPPDARAVGNGPSRSST